jgi:hypothetical protein
MPGVDFQRCRPSTVAQLNQSHPGLNLISETIPKTWEESVTPPGGNLVALKQGVLVLSHQWFGNDPPSLLMTARGRAVG